MTVKRMDNVGIVVDDLAATIDLFRELGLELEGRTTIEGEWAGPTPDGHGRLELPRFLTPPAVADHRNAPVNALGYLRIMFTVDDIDDTLERLRKRGARLVDTQPLHQKSRNAHQERVRVLVRIPVRDRYPVRPRPPVLAWTHVPCAATSCQRPSRRT